MSKLVYKNLLKDNVSSVTHTSTTGTITAVTPLANIYDRSRLKSYQYTISTVAPTHTITITLTDTVTISSFAILNFSTLYNTLPAATITLKDSVDATITKTNETEQTGTRIVQGVSYSDYITFFDDEANVKKIEISFLTTETSGSTLSIGTIYAGVDFDVNVKPGSLSYTFGADGDKQRTDGGQIIASQNNSYLKAKFTVAAELETNLIANHFNLNYVASVSEPVIFVPQSSSEIILYGTQEKPNTAKPVMKNDGDSTPEWYYETSYQLEEEF